MSELLKELVDRFLMWPLPKSVCADLCATNREYQFPRAGTNLLSPDEARHMIEHVFGPEIERLRAQIATTEALQEDQRQLDRILQILGIADTDLDPADFCEQLCQQRDALGERAEKAESALTTAQQEIERLTGIIGTLEASYRGLQGALSRYSTEKATEENALATAEAAGMERAAQKADARRRWYVLPDTIAEAEDRTARTIAADIRSLIPSVQSHSSVKSEVEGLRAALEEIRTDVFLLGTAINEHDPYDELFVRVNDIMRHVNTALSSKEPTP